MADSIGKTFKDARRDKGLSIGEVGKKTKIANNVISAIEEDNFDFLSPIYMKGFIKMYANFLGLNAQDILKQYLDFTGQSSPEPVRPKFSPAPVNQRNIAKSILQLAKKNIKFIIVILIIIGFIGLFSWGKSIFKSMRKASARAVKVKTVENAAKINENGFQPLSITDSLIRLSVKAKLDCWLRVRVDEKLIFQGILKKGEVEAWQAKEKIEMKLGNPAAVDLELNGRVLEQFGRRGSKSDFVTITREGLKIGK